MELITRAKMDPNTSINITTAVLLYLFLGIIHRWGRGDQALSGRCSSRVDSSPTRRNSEGPVQRGGKRSRGALAAGTSIGHFAGGALIKRPLVLKDQVCVQRDRSWTTELLLLLQLCASEGGYSSVSSCVEPVPDG